MVIVKSRMCLGKESMEREKSRCQEATRKIGQEHTDAKKRKVRKLPRPSQFQQTTSVRTKT